jgi:hypothetical protein
MNPFVENLNRAESLLTAAYAERNLARAELRAAREMYAKEIGPATAYAERLAREAAAQFYEMLDALHPGFSRITLDEITAAMQVKYGSAARQYDIAVQRAKTALATVEGGLFNPVRS